MTENSASETRRCPRCAETIQSAAKVCRFCGAAFGPNGEVRVPPAPSKSRGCGGAMGCIGVFVLLAIGAFVFLSISGGQSLRDMERRAQQARNTPVPSGAHCLDPSLGDLHADLWLQVKRSLHDPDSMKDMVMAIEPVNANQQHKIRFQFRAKNAYGALRLQTVEAYVMAMGCVLVRWKLV